MTFIDALTRLQIEMLVEEPMSRHTSFRIGGPAEIMVMPKSTEEFLRVWENCKQHEIPLTVLGDGTNVLVADEGIRGVIVVTNKMNGIEKDGELIRAQAGARLSKVAEVACKAGLDGFAGASGIPGTVGGAVFMNAGAYDYCTSDFCQHVSLLVEDSQGLAIVVKSAEEMEFGYRKSIIQQGQSRMFVLDATFKLTPGDPAAIRAKMHELNTKRRNSQPLEFPSAGSAFKRPEGHYAGALIRNSGLKGFTIGGAQVSEKHAGFIINTGGATAKDVLDLVEAVRQKVFADAGVWLEPEIRILGDMEGNYVCGKGNL